MHRFYADPERSSESVLFLTPEDARHAVSVLRLSEGDPVELFWNENRYRARILSVSGTEVTLEKEKQLPSTEPALSVTLFQGLPKGDKMDWIVQKAVEIGVTSVVPVMMSRCIVRLDAKDAIRKTERWQKIAREAGKQCGRCVIPMVALPVPLMKIPEHFASMEYMLVPWEECAEGGPLAFYRKHPSVSSLGVLIGPEGGISGEEMDFLSSSGAHPITLGKRILRTETAGLAAVSALFGLYGEMENE